MILENQLIMTIEMTQNDNEVFADILIKDDKLDLWKEEFDNWCIQFKDDKKSFILNSIEIF